MQIPAALLGLLGEVARHREEAAQLAVVAMHGSNRNARPETAPIPADLPGFMDALGSDRVPILDREANGPSARIQRRVISPDHLLSRVPEDPFRAGVPAQHLP